MDFECGRSGATVRWCCAIFEGFVVSFFRFYVVGVSDAFGVLFFVFAYYHGVGGGGSFN